MKYEMRYLCTEVAVEILTLHALVNRHLIQNLSQQLETVLLGASEDIK